MARRSVVTAAEGNALLSSLLGFALVDTVHGLKVRYSGSRSARRCASPLAAWPRGPKMASVSWCYHTGAEQLPQVQVVSITAGKQTSVVAGFAECRKTSHSVITPGIDSTVSSHPRTQTSASLVIAMASRTAWTIAQPASGVD